MRTTILLNVILFFFLKVTSQDLTGSQLLEKSISYHDPSGVWSSFKSNFVVTMKSPDRPIRRSKIELDISKLFFKLTIEDNGNKLVSTLDNNDCSLSFNGNETFSKEIATKFRLNCERASMYRDYYTYLYGLPMKLNDKGTIIDKKLMRNKLTEFNIGF